MPSIILSVIWNIHTLIRITAGSIATRERMTAFYTVAATGIIVPSAIITSHSLIVFLVLSSLPYYIILFTDKHHYTDDAYDSKDNCRSNAYIKQNLALTIGLILSIDRLLI